MHDFKNHYQSNATSKPVYTLPRALVDGAIYTIAVMAMGWGIGWYAMIQAGVM